MRRRMKGFEAARNAIRCSVNTALKKKKGLTNVFLCQGRTYQDFTLRGRVMCARRNRTQNNPLI